MYRFVLPFLLLEPFLLLGSTSRTTLGSQDGLIVRLLVGRFQVLRIVDGRKWTKAGDGSLGGGSLGSTGDGVQLHFLWEWVRGNGTWAQKGDEITFCTGGATLPDDFLVGEVDL
jgi:hypothetical protein